MNSFVDFSQFIRPICLPFRNDNPDEITGLIFGSRNSQPEKLLKVGLTKFSNQDCQRNLGPHPKNNENSMHCYGHKNKSSKNYEVSMK